MDVTQVLPVPASARATMENLKSRDLKMYLRQFIWSADGSRRWDAGRAGCYHCGSMERVSPRHLCLRCRRETFFIPANQASSNPFVRVGGYKFCQRNCRTVPLPLDCFPEGQHKCFKCFNSRVKGLRARQNRRPAYTAAGASDDSSGVSSPAASPPPRRQPRRRAAALAAAVAVSDAVSPSSSDRAAGGSAGDDVPPPPPPPPSVLRSPRGATPAATPHTATPASSCPTATYRGAVSPNHTPGMSPMPMHMRGGDGGGGGVAATHGGLPPPYPGPAHGLPPGAVSTLPPNLYMYPTGPYSGMQHAAAAAAAAMGMMGMQGIPMSPYQHHAAAGLAPQPHHPPPNHMAYLGSHPVMSVPYSSGLTHAGGAYYAMSGAPPATPVPAPAPTPAAASPVVKVPLASSAQATATTPAVGAGVATAAASTSDHADAVHVLAELAVATSAM